MEFPLAKAIRQGLRVVSITIVCFTPSIASSAIPCFLHHCPLPDKTCVLSSEPTEVKKSCYRVECRDVCIPSIRFPWQKCVDSPRCGKVIRVKVLVDDSRSCPDCKHDWNIVPICGCCARAQWSAQRQADEPVRR